MVIKIIFVSSLNSKLVGKAVNGTLKTYVIASVVHSKKP